MDGDGDQVMDGQVGQNVGQNANAYPGIPREAIPPLLPGGAQMPPAAQPPIDPAVLDKGRLALRDLPRFDRTGVHFPLSSASGWTPMMPTGVATTL